MQKLLTPLTVAAWIAAQSVPVLAQTTTPAAPAPAAPAPAAPPTTVPAPSEPPAAAAPGAAATAPTAPTTRPTPKHHARVSLAARFAAANTTKDGHLTHDQADTAKWTYVSRHFDAIDKDHKGYVTVDDIHAFSRANHAARRHAPAGTSPAAPASSAPAPAAPAPAAPAPAASTPAPSGSTE